MKNIISAVLLLILTGCAGDLSAPVHEVTITPSSTGALISSGAARSDCDDELIDAAAYGITSGIGKWTVFKQCMLSHGYVAKRTCVKNCGLAGTYIGILQGEI